MTLPKGVRIWEQWSLNSKEQPTPATVGIFDNLVAWADFEGLPRFSQLGSAGRESPETSRLAILRSGPLLPVGALESSHSEHAWASNDSFSALNRFCCDFLKWHQFSIRSLRAKAIFEWEKSSGSPWTQLGPQLKIIHGCDGPIIQILRTIRSVCEEQKGT